MKSAKASATLSERGQLVIPKSLRLSLGLKPRMTIAMEEVNGKLILTPERDLSYLDAAFKKWRGTGRQNLLDAGYESVDEYIEDIRGR